MTPGPHLPDLVLKALNVNSVATSRIRRRSDAPLLMLETPAELWRNQETQTVALRLLESLAVSWSTLESLVEIL